MTALDRYRPRVLVADDWSDYALLDSGGGAKLEQVGRFRFIRPEPQALWERRSEEALWAGADGAFQAGGEDDDGGRWRFTQTPPETWPLTWNGLRFLSRATPFRHLAFFPEHSVHWRFAEAVTRDVGTGAEVLNLFGYTGLASLAAARAGARVTHVDASKKAIGYARENQDCAGLGAAPIRWIADDAHSFVRREIRRGRRYDGIILDPPKYGRGPQGETWRLEESLPALLRDCASLLSRDAPRAFLILTVYAVRLSPLALAQIAEDACAFEGGQWETGEMGLPHCSDDRILPTALFARWSR